MDYTPRQATAFVAMAEHRRRQDLRLDLVVGTLASRGEDRAVRAQLKEWGE
jgi:hypothetical protein